MDGHGDHPDCECRFDWGVRRSGIVRALLLFPGSYRARLDRVAAAPDGPTRLRRRPAPGVWCILEYVAHTRDAVAWYGQRIRVVVDEDNPQLAAFDGERACDERRYVDEDPSDVIRGLTETMGATAELLGDLDTAAWRRTGIGTDGGTRSVLHLARRAVHEGHHHLDAIDRIGPPHGPGHRSDGPGS